MDAHKNFAIGTVLVPPSPAISGTSLTLDASQGTLFPTVPFNAILFPVDASPSSTNAEIVRITNTVGDVLTITRAQEGTTARTIAAGWKLAAGLTAKVLTDIEDALEGRVSGSTWRMKAGKLYMKNPGGGATPWHEITPVIQDTILSFSISETGEA